MGLINVMNLNTEQLNDIKHAVAFYMMNHVSIQNPRYKEYQNILTLLSEEKTNDYSN